jgi:hypothetical protein
MKKILASVLAALLLSTMAVSSLAYTVPSPGSWSTDDVPGPRVPPLSEKPAAETPASETTEPEADEGSVQVTTDGTIVVTLSPAEVADGEVKVPVTAPDGSTVIFTGADTTPIKVTLPVDGADDRTIVVTDDGAILDAELTDDGLVFVIPGDCKLTVGDAAGFYSDVEGYWAEDAIAKIVASRLMVGYPDGKFHPEDGLSAAMVYTVLARIAGADIVTTGDDWVANVTAWAEAAGIADGSDPTAEVTREQTIKMLAKAAGIEGDPVEWAKETQLFIGFEDGELKLEENLTRAQFATVLCRYLGK